MKILKNKFILPFISLLLIISLTFAASAASQVDVETYFKEAKRTYLKADDTFTYSKIEENGDDRFIVKDLELYLAETKRLFKYDQLEFTFTTDVNILNSSLSNIIAKGHTLTVREGDERNELKVDQIKIDGTVMVMEETLLFPQSTTITSTKVAMHDHKNGFQADLDELKVVGLKRANKDILSIDEVILSPVSGQTNNELEGSTSNFSFDGILLKNITSEKGILFTTGLAELGTINFDFTNKEQDVLLVMDGITAKNVTLNLGEFGEEAETADDIPLFPFDHTSYVIKPMTIKMNGKTFLTTEEMVFENNKVDENQTYAQSLKINDIFVDMLAAPEPPKNIEQMKALGLTKLNLNMEVNAIWNLETGLLDISNYLIDIQQMGKIGMSTKLDGITEEVFKKFQMLQTQMQKIKDPEKQNQASMALLSAISGVKVNALSLKVTDRDFLDKVMLITMQSQEKVDQTREMTGPMVGMMMAPYNIPEFTQSLAAALSTFMQGNKSIEIAAEPETGLTVMEIIGLSAGIQSQTVQPADFIKRLNLTIKAE